MPSFEFTASIPWDYPETRDVHGVLIGPVQPGDIAELDQAPDRNWRPCESPAEKPVPAGRTRKADPAAADSVNPAGQPGSNEAGDAGEEG